MTVVNFHVPTGKRPAVELHDTQHLFCSRRDRYRWVSLRSIPSEDARLIRALLRPDSRCAVIQNFKALGLGRGVYCIAATDKSDHRNVVAQALVEHGFVSGGDACIRIW